MWSSDHSASLPLKHLLTWSWAHGGEGGWWAASSCFRTLLWAFGVAHRLGLSAFDLLGNTFGAEPLSSRLLHCDCGLNKYIHVCGCEHTHTHTPQNEARESHISGLPFVSSSPHFSSSARLLKTTASVRPHLEHSSFWWLSWSSKRPLTPSLMTRVPSLGPTRKERTNSHKLSSGLHLHTKIHICAHTSNRDKM